MSDVPKQQNSPPVRSTGPDPHSQIASKLKALYTSVENEPLPDMFLDLLEQLDRTERLSKG